MTTGKAVDTDSTLTSQLDSHHVLEDDQTNTRDVSRVEQTHKLVRRMRWQIWAGTIAGFIIALAIGAAFIAVVCSASLFSMHHTVQDSTVTKDALMC
jgi:high-affinity iron transporter